MKLSELSNDLGLEHRGGDLTIRAVSPVEKAGPEDLSFVTSARFLPRIQEVGALIVAPAWAEDPAVVAKPRLISTVPSVDAARAARRMGQHCLTFEGVHPQAMVAATARLGEGVFVGPGAVVGAGVAVGEGSQIHAGVVIYDRCLIGKRCVIKANAVIGGEGFGYEYVHGRHEPIPHFGTVRVEDDVHIGSGTCIDRARFGETVIGAGTRIDNQVQIGHNVQIGRGCLIVSQVGIAGSVVVEDGVVLAGQVGVIPHVTIGAGAKVGASTGIITDVPAGMTWSGWFGQPYRASMQQQIAVRKLPDFIKKVQVFMSRHGG